MPDFNKEKLNEYHEEKQRRKYMENTTENEKGVAGLSYLILIFSFFFVFYLYHKEITFFNVGPGYAAMLVIWLLAIIFAITALGVLHIRVKSREKGSNKKEIVINTGFVLFIGYSIVSFFFAPLVMEDKLMSDGSVLTPTERMIGFAVLILGVIVGGYLIIKKAILDTGGTFNKDTLSRIGYYLVISLGSLLLLKMIFS